MNFRPGLKSSMAVSLVCFWLTSILQPGKRAGLNMWFFTLEKDLTKIVSLTTVLKYIVLEHWFIHFVPKSILNPEVWDWRPRVGAQLDGENSSTRKWQRLCWKMKTILQKRSLCNKPRSEDIAVPTRDKNNSSLLTPKFCCFAELSHEEIGFPIKTEQNLTL